jgi:aryl sulfotransferase
MMPGGEISWPVKTREMFNHHFDSTMWSDFAFRADDIVISTYAKSGTTWMQQIVSQLIFNGEEGAPVSEMSPWVDIRLPSKQEKMAMLEAQTHRRFVKTHLPVDALVFSPDARYLYIGRDGRDVLWSLHNHHLNMTDDAFAEINGPGLVGPPLPPAIEDVHAYFRTWLERDGYPFWSFWENARSWWEVRDLPNVMLVHFADLKADMPGEIRRVAEFLEIPIDEAVWPAIVEHCGFDYMKEHAAATVPDAGAFWKGGAKTFIHKGKNGRWRDVLTEADCAAYEARAARELGADCARWFAEGGAAA